MGNVVVIYSFISILANTQALSRLYSHFLIFKKVKINNKYIIFKIVVKYKIIKKIKYVKRKFK